MHVRYLICYYKVVSLCTVTDQIIEISSKHLANNSENAQ